MTLNSAVWLVIGLALVGANLPFLNHRWLTFGPAVLGRKRLWVRLAELLFWYLVVGGVALGLEQQLGQRHPQAWEFYAVTGSMYLTLAFPGFVYRCLVKRR